MGGTYSVVAEISKDATNGAKTSYHWKNGHTIYLTRKDEPNIKTTKDGGYEKPLENYKQYKHKLPENNAWLSVTYELKAINHNGNRQVGLDTRSGFKDHRTLEVVYWLNDQHNSFPLIIGLGDYSLSYFKRKNDTTNGWEESGIIYPATISEYNKLLCKLNEKFQSVVAIQLQSDKDYCGHTSAKQGESPPKDCEEKTDFPIVSVTCNSQDKKGFDKYTHAFGQGYSMKILSALHSGNLHSFGKRDINTQYKNVNVYYSSTDSGRNKPLITELVLLNGGQSEYYTFDGKLIRVHAITGQNLLKYLDEQNCMLNNIVVADLSKKRDKYCCGMSNHNKIQVHQSSRNLPVGYTSYMHLPIGSATLSIYRFKNGSHTHTFSNLSGRITGIYAYFCNKDLNKALLIYVNKGSGSAWFKRTSGDGNTWTETGLNSLKNHTPNSPSIKQHIGDVLHSICKDLQIVGCQHASSTSVVSVSSSGSEGSASSSGSSGSSGGGSSGVGPGPPGESGGKGETGDRGELGEPNARVLGPPGGQGSASSQNFGEQILDFITSHPAVIAGSTVAGVLGTGLVGVTIWKWPSIMSFLIARL